MRTASKRAPSVTGEQYFTNGSIALGVSATTSIAVTAGLAHRIGRDRRTAEVGVMGSPRWTCATSLRASPRVISGTAAGARRCDCLQRQHLDNRRSSYTTRGDTLRDRPGHQVTLN